MTVHDYPPFYNGIGARLLLRRHHLKSVLEIHHIVGWPMPASFIERIGYWLTRLVISGHTNHFDVVRTVSSSVKNQLVRLGVSSANISIVPSFYLDASVLKPAFEAEKKYDVVFCGRLTKNKGLSILIEALEDLPGKKLLVIGDGPERKRCEDQVRRSDMSDRVRFAGWLPDQLSVIRELRTARVFVLPSLSEGGPRIALEAMALGLPVIATRVGVLPDVIEDGTNGVFTTGEPEDLRTNIAALLLDGAKRTAIGQAGTKILLRFERTKLIREYAEFLKDVRC
jgi:glycosyltransferase involved in cell wall biosynthesis